jgi:hypothetical protein
LASWKKATPTWPLAFRAPVILIVNVAVGCPFAGRAGVCAASDLGKRVVVSRDNPDKTTIAAIR